MPTTTQALVRAYAHCTESRCPGNAQEEVDAYLEETTWLFTENGGNLPAPERSSVNLRFVNLEESTCSCGRGRDLSATPRKQFDGTISGYDPKGLLEMQAAGVEFDPKVVPPDPERERLEAENRDLSERLAKVEGFLMGRQESEGDHAYRVSNTGEASDPTWPEK